MTRARASAREYAFMLIFERLFLGQLNEVTLKIFSKKAGEQAEYLAAVANKSCEEFESLSQKIEEYSEGFKLNRMHKVDLALLLLAATEMLYFDDIPNLVSLNEVLDLAKKYSGEKSVGFVHGILKNFVNG